VGTALALFVKCVHVCTDVTFMLKIGKRAFASIEHISMCCALNSYNLTVFACQAMWDKDVVCNSHLCKYVVVADFHSRRQVGANDSIGECSLNLAAVMKKAYMTKKAASLPERWLPFMHPNFR
jgi:hypothetical protein